MMEIIVADDTKACRLFLYYEKYEEMMSDSCHSLLIANAINKRSHLVVTSSTVVSIAPKLKIPPAVLNNIKEKHQTVNATKPSSSKRKYAEVTGKVSQILPLKQALAKEVDEKVTIRVMLVEVMLLEVRGLSIGPKYMMEVIVADESQSCSLILSHDIYEKWMSCPCQSLLITNAINKQECLVVEPTTVINMGPKFTIPPAVFDGIKHKHQTVKAAMSSPEGMVVSIIGKVSKINVPPLLKELNNKMELCTVVTLEDDTAPVSLEFWGPEAENIKMGQVLALENVKVLHFMGGKRLTNTPVSIMKIISNEQLSHLSEDEQDEQNLRIGTIIGLIEVEPYSSCPVTQCRNTQLTAAEKDGMLMCPNHGQLVAPKDANLYMYARFHVQISGNKICTLVAYMPELKSLFEAKGEKFNPTYKKKILEKEIFSILPYTLRFLERNGIIESVCPKRRIP